MPAEIQFVLSALGKIAVPLLMPVVFAGIWHLYYRIRLKTVPEGAVRATVIWFIATFIASPLLFGFGLLAGLGSHGRSASYMPVILVVVGALIWLSIIPILLYKSRLARSKARAND